MSRPKKSTDLPVYIVEQHNDVVPFIHRAIGSKLLPFSGIPIIHLDSHPDLLLPPHLEPQKVFEPHALYQCLSIENWLLPLTYAKHIDYVVWVKPPWAQQIKPMEQEFQIGKCQHTGKLRLSSKENYFMTDGLYCQVADLLDSSKVKLTVVEMLPECWQELDSSYTHSSIDSSEKKTSNSNKVEESLHNTLKNESKSLCIEIETTADHHSTNQDSAISQHDDLTHPEKWARRLHDGVKDKPYILDIDLDFFSTANPFKDMLTADEEENLRRLYRYQSPSDMSDKSCLEFTRQRDKQLTLLESIFSSLETKWASCNRDEVKGQTIEDLTMSELTGMEAKCLECLNAQQQEDIKYLTRCILTEGQRRDISFTQLHDFGCTLDDTELPHHISTPDQVEALNKCLHRVLEILPKPAIVTISRSSHDDYCPKTDVDKFQQTVLKMLEDLHGSLQVTKDYE